MIDVRSFADASLFAANCRVADVDFDGHADLATLAEFGAKWGRYDLWRYDPGTRRFVQDSLAADLGRLRASELRFDAPTRTVHAAYLLLGTATVGETYAIRGGRLVRTAVTERKRDGRGGFEIVTRKVPPAR